MRQWDEALVIFAARCLECSARVNVQQQTLCIENCHQHHRCLDSVGAPGGDAVGAGQAGDLLLERDVPGAGVLGGVAGHHVPVLGGADGLLLRGRTTRGDWGHLMLKERV